MGKLKCFFVTLKPTKQNQFLHNKHSGVSAFSTSQQLPEQLWKATGTTGLGYGTHLSQMAKMCCLLLPLQLEKRNFP